MPQARNKRKPVKVSKLSIIDKDATEDIEGEEEDGKKLARSIRNEATEMAKSILGVRETGNLLQARGQIESFNGDDIEYLANNLGQLQREMLKLINGRDYSNYSDRELAVAMHTTLGMLRQQMPQINEGVYEPDNGVGQRSHPADYSPARVGVLLDEFDEREERAFMDAGAGGDYGYVARYPHWPQPRVV